jgi:hypothetical protein
MNLELYIESFPSQLVTLDREGSYTHLNQGFFDEGGRNGGWER